MSKIKLRFIISTIFCSIFMATMSTVAMENNEENKINMNYSLDLKENEIDLTDEDRALIKKETEKLDKNFELTYDKIENADNDLDLKEDEIDLTYEIYTIDGDTSYESKSLYEQINESNDKHMADEKSLNEEDINLHLSFLDLADFEFDDLNKLKFDKFKGIKVRILPSKKYIKNCKYIDMSDKLGLLKMYSDQFDCYLAHFKEINNSISSKNNPLLTHSNIIYTNNPQLHKEINNNYIIFNQYLKNENYSENTKKHYFKIEDLVKNFNDIEKAIKSVKNILSMDEIKNDSNLLGIKNDIENKIIKINDIIKNIIKTHWGIGSFNVKKAIETSLNEVQSYIWHLKNILKSNKNNLKSNKNNLKSNKNNLIGKESANFNNVQLSEYGNYEDCKEIMKQCHCIKSIDDFNLFKSSNIYKKYYKEDKYSYKLKNLVNDMVDLTIIKKNITTYVNISKICLNISKTQADSKYYIENNDFEYSKIESLIDIYENKIRYFNYDIEKLFDLFKKFNIECSFKNYLGKELNEENIIFKGIKEENINSNNALNNDDIKENGKINFK